MNILKLALLGSLRLAFFSMLKVALFVYILFLPDSPFVGVEPEGEGRIGNTASNAAQEARATPPSGKRDAVSSQYLRPV
jgi:hypothetical protein